MNHLVSEIDVASDDVVHVELSGTESDVFLADTANYHAFRQGGSFRYTGGHYRCSPVDLVPPHAGHWYVVIMPKGGRVSASVSVLHAR